MNELKKQFLVIVGAEATRIGRVCRKVSPAFDEKTIHKLRTRVKKFRALLRWQGAAGNLFTPSFKKVYRAAGDIRDGQVLIAEIEKENTVPPAFISWLTTRTSLAKGKWDETYDKRQLREWEKEAKSLKINVKFTTPRQFFKKKQGILQQNQRTTPLIDEKIHTGRKAIKDMQYVLEWHEKIGLGRYKPATSFSTIKKTGEKAGEYMDKSTALRLIRAYLRQEEDAIALETGHTLRRQWEKEKRTMKKELINMFKNLKV